jgi:protein-tyrosine phosphatase
VLPSDKPEDDDVIDPYGRSWQTYELSAAQLTPALEQVVRVLQSATRD